VGVNFIVNLGVSVRVSVDSLRTEFFGEKNRKRIYLQEWVNQKTNGIIRKWSSTAFCTFEKSDVQVIVVKEGGPTLALAIIIS
jgi:hypothetical protein